MERMILGQMANARKKILNKKVWWLKDLQAFLLIGVLGRKVDINSKRTADEGSFIFLFYRILITG